MPAPGRASRVDPEVRERCQACKAKGALSQLVPADERGETIEK
jgi:hypothetical protein